jgi:integrase
MSGMSRGRIRKQDNGTWKVYWDEKVPATGKWRQRSKTFDRKGDAETWNDRRRDDRNGIATLEPITLTQFLAGQYRPYTVGLAPATRLKNAWALEQLGDLLDIPLTDITAGRLAAEQQRLLDAGASAYTIKLAFGTLAKVLQVAYELERVGGNPAKGMRLVKRHTPGEVQPLDPRELEQLLADLKATPGANARWGQRGYIIGLLGGHAGLRPMEIRNLPWHAHRDGMLHVRVEDTKDSAARPRSIALPAVTDLALKEWRLRSGGRGRDPIVGAMTESALKQWGTKTLRRHVEQITDGRITDATTYTLRHSHASQLHYASFTPAGAAKRMGHTLQTHYKHYQHVIDSLEGRPRAASLDELIAAARAEAAGMTQAGLAAAPGPATP